MGKPTAQRRQHVDADLRAWLEHYQPRNIDLQKWSAVRPFVLGLADRLDLVGQASTARVVRVLARIVAWSVGEGLALDCEIVLDPDTVERFVAFGLADDRSRATYRAVVRRVAPLLTHRAPWEPRPEAVARRQVAVPYTLAELNALRVDAALQPTAGRRRAARALFVLGAGLGWMAGGWLGSLPAM